MPATPAQLLAFATGVTALAKSIGFTGVVKASLDGVDVPVTPPVVAPPILVATPLAMIAGQPVAFDGKRSVWAGGADGGTKPILTNGTVTTWTSDTADAALKNVVLKSADGKGFGGKVRGKRITISGVDFTGLNDALQFEACEDLTITNCRQIGRVTGRTFYFLGVNRFTFSNSSTGPAETQSPIRFSTFNGLCSVDGLISNVTATQVLPGDNYRIATWAIHALKRTRLINCTGIGGEVSLDGAGDGQGNEVSDCIFENWTITDTKLRIDSIAYRNTFKGGTYRNLTGECVSVQCPTVSGNVIDGVTFVGDRHAVHFYIGSDLIVRNCTFLTNNKSAQFITGAWTAANDGGGNTIKAMPAGAK